MIVVAVASLLIIWIGIHRLNHQDPKVQTHLMEGSKSLLRNVSCSYESHGGTGTVEVRGRVAESASRRTIDGVIKLTVIPGPAFLDDGHPICGGSAYVDLKDPLGSPWFRITSDYDTDRPEYCEIWADPAYRSRSLDDL